MVGDKARDEQASSPSSSSSPVGHSGSVTRRLIQSTSLPPLKPVNRRTDDVTVTSPASLSSLPAVNVRQSRAVFESRD